MKPWHERVFLKNMGTISIIALLVTCILLFMLQGGIILENPLIGASNHFEVAIATAVTVFGLTSGAALSTVVGVLIEVPIMLVLVRICLRTRSWFPVMKKAV